MEIFKYGYMVRALIAGFFLSAILPAIGIVVVNKRISVIGDSLSHVSLAGVLFGLIVGISPTLGALLFCIIAAIFLELIRRKIPGYADMATSIIMSLGVGIASLLSGFIKTSANFESFLFGSIITISISEFYFILAVSLVVLFMYLFIFKELMYISFDEQSARLSGVKVELINFIFMVLIAATISVASRTVGVLIISSIMVIPSACAMQFDLGYYKTSFLCSFFGIFFTISGLLISFYLNLKPGGTIVLMGVITLVLVLTFKRIKR